VIRPHRLAELAGGCRAAGYGCRRWTGLGGPVHVWITGATPAAHTLAGSARGQPAAPSPAAPLDRLLARAGCAVQIAAVMLP